MKRFALVGLVCWLGFGAVPTPALAQPQAVKAGAGSYFLAPKGSDKGLPSAPFRTPTMLAQAAPTNQWYSTLVFNPQPFPLFVQPMTVRTVAAGFEMVLPSKEVTTTERRDTEVGYPHRNPLLLSPTAFAPGPAKLAKAGDWSIDISFAQGDDDMQVTVAHGSPYAHVRLTRGDLRLTLPGEAQRIHAGVPSNATDAKATDAKTTDVNPHVLALRLNGQAYALFAPQGGRWVQDSALVWTAKLPAGKHYVAAAVLPDEQPQSLALLARHAFAMLDQTRVDWRYDAASSRVETTFTATTRVLEGPDNGPLLGLYPHHWFNNPLVQGQLGPAYSSVRGKIHLLAASQFKTSFTHTGFVPFWPAVAEGPRKAELADLMKADLRNARRMMLPEGQGAYWQGKGLQRIVKLLDVVEQQGDTAGREQLLALLKKRMEEWFSGADAKRYFFRDKSLGTVASYPDEFSAIAEINDHHFWWGYWIRAAAEIALRDPAWAAPERWGGMVNLLVADIATTQRGGADFPFLRTFDAYEGHSWASGVGGVGAYGQLGNNQESSSEAVNAWVGLVLWGEVTGNSALRDLGLYLATTEWKAIEHYWFDVHGLVLAPEYKNVDVAQLFGGKYIHNTWWTDDPRQATGINLLPITTASTPFAQHPAYIKRNLNALKEEQAIWAARGKRYDPPDVWQDVFAKYAALADPAQGLAAWDRWGAVELGETRSHTLHWLLSLNHTGPPDLSTTANTPLYAVFQRADGQRTYMAYNAGTVPLTVRFSDGKTLLVAPSSLGRSN